MRVLSQIMSDAPWGGLSYRKARVPWRPALLGLALVLAQLAPHAAHAADDFFYDEPQTPSPITDRFALRASFFHASVQTDLRVDQSGQPLGGTPISGKTDLGFGSSENDGTVELMFRLRDRNRITADYFELDQAGTTTVGRQIAFGNQTFFPGEVASSALQWRVLSLTWTYAIIQNDRFELGAGLGLHLMDLDVRAAVPARLSHYEASDAGILPTPALEAAWRATRRFAVTARVEYLKGTLNGISSTQSDLHADVQYRVVPNVALGAGYSLVRFKLDSLTQGNPGLIGLRLRGPELFVRASF